MSSTRQSDQLFPLVTAADRLMGNVTYSILRAKNAHPGNWTRYSAVVIKNKKGKVLLQQRSKAVDSPLKWGFSAVGHVHSGETYFQAAGRELEEETGIHCKMKKLAKFSIEEVQRHYVLYLAVSEGPFKKNREVRQLRFFEVDEISQNINKSPNKYMPSLQYFIKNYRNVILNAN